MKTKSSSSSRLKRSAPKQKPPRTEELRGDARVYSYLTQRPSVPRPIRSEQIYSMQQTVITQSFATTNIAIPTFFSTQFTLADLDQVASLVAVFDQYKIRAVEIWVENQGPNLNLNNPGRMVTVIDFNDITNLTTIAQATDYSNSLVSSGQSCQYRHFVPHQALATYNGAFTGFSTVPAQWNDTGSTSIRHYGLKVAFEPTSSAVIYDLTVKYHVLFKAVK